MSKTTSDEIKGLIKTYNLIVKDKEGPREPVDMFITKNALDYEGIVKMKLKLPLSDKGTIFSWSNNHGIREFDNTMWHLTESEAIKEAYEMKKRKIASLKEQLKKVQAMEFYPKSQ